uniref:polynucleotide adenylyltransferase n=1 Tax=Heterorhabditis bacteriophora TaxID=37862 RepID=A0A1I7XIV9_HETBA
MDRLASNSHFKLEIVKCIDRLRTVLNDTVDIHGKGNFPTISVRLIDIISCVREKLRIANMPPKCVKLNGGAASFIASADDFVYADLDLIFPMEVEGSDSFDKVR